MTDHEFREMLFATLADIKEQGKERYDRLEKRLETIEAQAKENNDRLEKRLETIETRVGGVDRDVGWIKGKLEGKQESSGRILVIFSTSAAITAVIIALIALFN